jgi:hypothetical protein
MALKYGATNMRGTFRALASASMLTHLRVRCASMLDYHPELHSRILVASSFATEKFGVLRG